MFPCLCGWTRPWKLMIFLFFFFGEERKKNELEKYILCLVVIACRDHRREVNNSSSSVAGVTAAATRAARRVISWVCGRRWSGTAIPRLLSSSADGSLNKAAMASCCGRNDGSPCRSFASSTTKVRTNPKSQFFLSFSLFFSLPSSSFIHPDLCATVTQCWLVARGSSGSCAPRWSRAEKEPPAVRLHGRQEVETDSWRPRFTQCASKVHISRRIGAPTQATHRPTHEANVIIREFFPFARS